MSSAVLLTPFPDFSRWSGAEFRIMYGPPPVPAGTTRVTGMYYIVGGNRVDLRWVDREYPPKVPVNSRFHMLFSADVMTDSVNIALTEVSPNIQCDVNWFDLRTAEIIPKAALQPNRKYTLVLVSGKDSRGNDLPHSLATFTTASE